MLKLLLLELFEKSLKSSMRRLSGDSQAINERSKKKEMITREASIRYFMITSVHYPRCGMVQRQDPHLGLGLVTAASKLP